MKKNVFSRILPLLCLILALTACGAQAAEAPADLPREETLKTLCGEDYQDFLIDTITMQMENRMEKTPDVVFFPIQDDKPLTDYAAIDETTAFEVDADGYVTILFPAGTVTDEANGAQSFRVLHIEE